MSSTFDTFAQLIDERLRTGVFTTEDAVRYTFFQSLLHNKFCQHTEIAVELPHPKIPGAKIDLHVSASNERVATAFEFKYDRPIPSEKNAPRTQKAGAVFKDLFRLARVPVEKAQQRYFVYLTSSEMVGYFRNPQNRLLSFFDLPENESLSLTTDFVNALAVTFQSVVRDTAIPCKVIGCYRKNMLDQYALRIYQVEG